MKFTGIRLIAKIKFVLVASIFAAISVNPAHSQQMWVDDAEITTYPSFQLETWYGSIESWFLPAISPLPCLELSTGVSFDSDDDFRHTSWLFEGKVAPSFAITDEHGFAMVAGFTTSPEIRTESAYLYVPYTRSILNNNSLLHVNLGYSATRDEEWNHGVFYGIRADIDMGSRTQLLSEIFTTDFDTPGFQAGVRIFLIDELLEMDITYGRGFDSEVDEPGFNLGLAFTPPPLW